MPLTLTRTVAPTEEPLTLDEVRDHLRYDTVNPGQDTWMTNSIVRAREYVESFQARQLVTATWQLKLDAFPGVIRLPRPPLQSVTSIAYTDENGDGQTLASSAYDEDLVSEPGRIVPAYNETWPITRPVINAVTVTYVAGYGAASSVPETVKGAMLLLIGHWFENREGTIVGATIATLPQGVDDLLWPDRILVSA